MLAIDLSLTKLHVYHTRYVPGDLYLLMEAWLGFPHQTLFRWRERKETHEAGGSFLNALEGHLQGVEEGSPDARVSCERCQKRFNVVRVRVQRMRLR